MSEQKYKIAILASHFPPTGAGGITTAHANLARLLIDRGHDVRFYTFLDVINSAQQDDPSWLVRSNLEATRLTRKKYGVLIPLRFLSLGAMAYQLADIVQAAGGITEIQGQLFDFNPDFVIVGDQCCPAWKLKLPSSTRLIWVSHHNPRRFIDRPVLKKHSRLDAALAHLVEVSALKKVKAVVAPSSYMSETFQQTYPWPGGVRIIPNVVRANLKPGLLRQCLRMEFKIPESAPILFVPSGASFFKGRDLLGDILARISDIWRKPFGICISGHIPTPLLNFLKKRTRPYGQIFAPGSLPHDVSLAYMAESDFIVSPSLIESFGMAILEGFFLGKPAVAFDVDAIPELVKNEQTGLLVDTGDVEGISRASTKLMENSSLRKTLGEESYDFANQQFSLLSIVEKWESLFSELV